MQNNKNKFSLFKIAVLIPLFVGVMTLVFNLLINSKLEIKRAIENTFFYYSIFTALHLFLLLIFSVTYFKRRDSFETLNQKKVAKNFILGKLLTNAFFILGTIGFYLKAELLLCSSILIVGICLDIITSSVQKNQE